MDTSKRAIRRHHAERLKQKYLRYNYWGVRDRASFSNYWVIVDSKKVKVPVGELVFKGKALQERLNRILSCPHPCSCMCCGNQRKFYGSTRKELKNILKLKEGIEEYYEFE